MRQWQYLLIADTEDPERALAGALAGDGPLVRTVPGTVIAHTARRDGTWGESEVLARMKYRGDVLWATEIDRATARRVLDAWHDAGRLGIRPPLDLAIPDELERQLDRQDHRSALAAELRAQAGLAPAELARVRRTLLDGPGLSPAWAHGAGRRRCRVDDMLILLDAQVDTVVARIRQAFAALGASTLWAVSTADAETAQLWPAPASVILPNELDWLEALGSVYFASGAFLLTEPRLSAAVLSINLRHVVAGPSGFVATVLGRAPGA